MLTDLKDNMNKYRETCSKFENSNDGPIGKKILILLSIIFLLFSSLDIIT